MISNEIISYLIELPTKGIWQAIKISFIILNLLLLGASIYLLFATEWYLRRYGYDLRAFLQERPSKKSKTAKKWQKIKARLERADEAEHKLAVIEAENFLLEFFAKQDFQGETLPEQLERISPKILPPEKLKEFLKAHQIRNNVIYDPDYKLTLDTAKKVIDVFEKTLQNFTEL